MFLFSSHLKIKQLHLVLHLLLTWHRQPQLWCQGWCLHHLWWCQLFLSTLLQVCWYGMSVSNSVSLKKSEHMLRTKEVRQICNTQVWKLERKRPLGTNGDIILKWTAKNGMHRSKLDSPGIRSGPVAFCCERCIILLSIKDGKFLEQLKDDKHLR